MYILGDRPFKNKAEAKQFVSNYLRTTQVIEEQDKAWIYDLISRHPRFDEKVGEIQCVCIKRVMGNNCFFVNTKHGCMEDISYIKCLAGKENKTTMTKSAFRYAIHDQIRQFKNELFSHSDHVICPISGLRLYNDAQTHIDHHFETLTFDDIILNFCREHNIDINSVETSSHGTYRTLTDKKIEDMFKQYHLQHANLRALHASANLAGKVI